MTSGSSWKHLNILRSTRVYLIISIPRCIKYLSISEILSNQESLIITLYRNINHFANRVIIYRIAKTFMKQNDLINFIGTFRWLHWSLYKLPCLFWSSLWILNLTIKRKHLLKEWLTLQSQNLIFLLISAIARLCFCFRIYEVSICSYSCHGNRYFSPYTLFTSKLKHLLNLFCWTRFQIVFFIEVA